MEPEKVTELVYEVVDTHDTRGLGKHIGNYATEAEARNGVRIHQLNHPGTTSYKVYCKILVGEHRGYCAPQPKEPAASTTSRVRYTVEKLDGSNGWTVSPTITSNSSFEDVEQAQKYAARLPSTMQVRIMKRTSTKQEQEQEIPLQCPVKTKMETVFVLQRYVETPELRDRHWEDVLVDPEQAPVDKLFNDVRVRRPDVHYRIVYRSEAFVAANSSVGNKEYLP